MATTTLAIASLLFLAPAVQAQTQFAVGTYDISGTYQPAGDPPQTISGTGVASNAGNSGTHSATSPSGWGTDDLEWDSQKGKYKITDGDNPSIQWGRLKITAYEAATKTYTCELQDSLGNNVGSETWTKTGG